PTADGHAHIAETVWKALKPLLLVGSTSMPAPGSAPGCVSLLSAAGLEGSHQLGGEPGSRCATSTRCDTVGGSGWESNPPLLVSANSQTALKAARVTGPESLPRASEVQAYKRLDAKSKGSHLAVTKPAHVSAR